jgi:hypothetical protein
MARLHVVKFYRRDIACNLRQPIIQEKEEGDYRFTMSILFIMDRKKKRVLIFNFMMVMGSCIQFNHRICHINLPEDSDGGDQYRESSLGWEIWC